MERETLGFSVGVRFGCRTVIIINKERCKLLLI